MKKCVRMKEKRNCTGCSACMAICPKHCISMKEDYEGFLYPVINRRLCIKCGKCKDVCSAIKKQKNAHVLQVNAAVNRVNKKREKSSSGGMFIALAERIIEKGGVVYGAVFDNEWMVHHVGASTIEEIQGMQGSKYVQSRMENCFCEIKDFLAKGVVVLFTGTPCQNAGLKAFLKKDYGNLYCVDIICHGVPSPKIWKKYLDFLDHKYGLNKKEGITPNFRSKVNGWNNYSLTIPIINGNYCYSNKEDLYLKTFLKNISLRPSCYNCSFKPSTNISDITIADFWEIENICSDMRDDKGTSLVIINSMKGKELFEQIKERLIYKEMSYDEAIKGNISAINSAEEPKDRKHFFLMLLFGRNILDLLKWAHYQTKGRILLLYIKDISHKVRISIERLIKRENED